MAITVLAEFPRPIRPAPVAASHSAAEVNLPLAPVVAALGLLEGSTTEQVVAELARPVPSADAQHEQFMAAHYVAARAGENRVVIRVDDSDPRKRRPADILQELRSNYHAQSPGR